MVRIFFVKVDALSIAIFIRLWLSAQKFLILMVAGVICGYVTVVVARYVLSAGAGGLLETWAIKVEREVHGMEQRQNWLGCSECRC